MQRKYNDERILKNMTTTTMKEITMADQALLERFHRAAADVQIAVITLLQDADDRCEVMTMDSPLKEAAY